LAAQRWHTSSRADMSPSHSILTLAALFGCVVEETVFALPVAPQLHLTTNFEVSPHGSVVRAAKVTSEDSQESGPMELMRLLSETGRRVRMTTRHKITPGTIDLREPAQELETAIKAGQAAQPAPPSSFPAAVASGDFAAGSGDTVLVSVMFGVLLTFDVLVSLAEYKLSNHVRTLCFMIAASCTFCAFVCYQRGEAAGVSWATGYALEWALSMDNLFVFHMVFKAFSVPNEHAMKALRLGIYGAIFFRVTFILFLTQLLSLSYWVDVVLGCILIFSGFMALKDDDDDEVQNMPAVRFFKWLAGSRLQDNYNADGSFVVRGENGELQMTVLFLVVCVVAVVDCIFAVDSVGAKTGSIKSVYINLTSSLMGMFSLRSLFFIIRDMAEYFDYVKYGICSILCMIGVEMLISKWVAVPLMWMCAVVVIIFTSSVAISIIKVLKTVGKGRGPIRSLTISHESGSSPSNMLDPTMTKKKQECNYSTQSGSGDAGAGA